MSRIRSVKPEFWLDRKLAKGASRDARLLYIGLWNHSDEHGRLHGDPAVIKGQVFPYDDVDVDQLLKELIHLERVVAYEHDGDPYLFLPTLARHQRLESGKVESRLPAPPEPGAHLSDDIPAPGPEPRAGQSVPRADEPEPRADSPGNSVALQVAGSRLQVAGGRGAAPGGAQTTKTTTGTRIPADFHVTDEMLEWATEHDLDSQFVQAQTERFVDYWQAKPGSAGRKTDWPATWRNWLRKALDDRGGSAGGAYARAPNRAEQRTAHSRELIAWAAEQDRLAGRTG